MGLFVQTNATHEDYKLNIKSTILMHHMDYNVSQEEEIDQGELHKTEVPKPYFMNEVFEKLQSLKGGNYPQLPSHTIFKGYKTVPIQSLPPKKPFQPYMEFDGREEWARWNLENLLFYQESCPISQKTYNGFFEAFYQAYINHGDVKITPDEVWSTIMVYFSKYVHSHAEQLRKAFVEHQGKKKLVVVSVNETQKQWDTFFDQIKVYIDKNVNKGVTEQLQCDFSTTDDFFRVFSTATIMNSFQKYFDYERYLVGCGIQNIHMGGSLQDWLRVCDKTKSLTKYDVDGELKAYIKGLRPILDQFVETFKGRPHLEFWNNIYQERSLPAEEAYDPSVKRNGWLIRFFTTDDQLQDIVPIEEINVQIKLFNEIKQTTKNLELVGGCKGISVEKGRVYRPHFSFAVVEKDSLSEEGGSDREDDV